MSCLSKIFTGVLNKGINKLCDENNVISDCQFGFRRGCSTTDASFVLHNLIQMTLNNRGRLYCAFVDLKKSFDSIYRNALLYKLFNLGIKGKTFRIIETEKYTCLGYVNMLGFHGNQCCDFQESKCTYKIKNISAVNYPRLLILVQNKS